MTVSLVDYMGTDLSVANAARVSFAKYKEAFDERDERLIRYLAKHSHWTPFAHTALSLRIKAPIFVARQLGKHQVGLVWNEVSRRYVDDEPSFHQPSAWRRRAENVKQGSSDETVDVGPNLHFLLRCAKRVYRELLQDGVCPEQARMVLPQSMLTEWFWTGSLYAFARVCKLRLDPHTQAETREIAQMISDICAGLFPVSWAALMEDER